LLTEKTEQQYRDEYRNQLIENEKDAQATYDKTLVTLSGGALGISFAFIDNIVGGDAMIDQWALFGAWIGWTGSLGCILFSYVSSVHSFRVLIDQVDKNQVNVNNLGGLAAKITFWLNALSGFFFIVGVFLMAYFVWRNL
jgi:hypothetical protein